MKLLSLILILVLLSSFNLSANDGVFYSQGGNLYPKKETTIQLKREVLIFTYLDTAVRVDIFFEFYNPGNVKTETVGFVSPPPSGDLPFDSDDMVDYNLKHPQIFEFYAIVNDIMQPWKVFKASESGFRTDNNSKFFHEYVYYFDAEFQKGTNIIQHSYIYKGSSSVEYKNEFFYRLTTGKMWANGQIDDFELLINMPGQGIYVPWSFQKSMEPAKWDVVGIGRLHDELTDFMGDTVRVGYLKNGMLRFRANNFKPDFDLHFGIMHYFNMLAFEANDLISDIDPHLVVFPYYFDYDYADLEEFTDFELMFLRNFIYAIHGYEFRNEELYAIFSMFSWYYPQGWKNETIDDELSPKEKQLINDIVKIEKSRE
ncbi:MAG: YARHG domain-containing protein [Bacteroidales bacterium]|nr:YARHG domain-containing protein [Bacteroidales bacterium]